MRTPQGWRDHLATIGEPMDGPPLWEGMEEAGFNEDRYQLAGEMTAKAMLAMADEDPTLLDIPADVKDPDMYGAAWDAAKEHWPGLDEWIGGITLNMFGWANGVVRYIHGKPPVGNPAIVTIRLP